MEDKKYRVMYVYGLESNKPLRFQRIKYALEDIEEKLNWIKVDDKATIRIEVVWETIAQIEAWEGESD